MTPKLLTKIKEEALGLLFPIKCVVCEKETGAKRKNKLICTDCLQKLSPSLNFFCPLCEARTVNGKPCFSCNLIIENTENKFYLDCLLYPFSYKEPAIQKIIKAFKYRLIKDLEIPLGRLIISYLEKVGDKIDLNDSVAVPVPLHKRKYNERGYNQSELIAIKLFEHLKSGGQNIEFTSDTLAKNKSTKDQVDLKESERPKNLKNVFVCLRPGLVSEKKILLVDDVYTTGTTMNECAKALKEAGAKEIIGLAIARG